MDRQLGPYQLIARIGAGGTAEVWSAKRTGAVQKTVALKILSGNYVDQDRAKRGFLREAALTLELHHQNIVAVNDVQEDGGLTYMVMEWIDGANLADLQAALRRMGVDLRPHIAAHVVGEIAQALAYAETAKAGDDTLGIVHRDLSPHNILVSNTGAVKVTDFGVARLLHEETTALHQKGKLRYVAPEQLAKSQPKPTMDLYSLGVILHELLVGEPLRKGTTPHQLEHEVMAATIPAIERADLPTPLVELRTALLQPDPRERLQSAEDVLAALRAWPGYINATSELGELCRVVTGVDAPRSGLHPAVDTPPLDPQAATPGTAAPDRSATVRTEPEPVSPTPRRRATAWSAFAIVVAAVAGGGTVAVYDRMTVEPSPEPIEPAQPVTSAPPPRTATPEQPPPDSEPAAPEPAPTPGPAPKVDTPDAAAVTAAPEKTKPQPKKRRERVLTKWRLDGPRTVWVLLDGRREIILEPLIDIELPVGRHRVQYRTRSKAPWRPGGRITLKPGRVHTIFMSEAGPRVERK